MKSRRLTDLLRNSLRDNPAGSEAEIREACWGRVKDNPAMCSDLFQYWFNNSYRDFVISWAGEHAVAVVPAERGPRAISAKQDRAVAVQSIVAKMEAKLLDFALSDGTVLRHATFGQCGRDGGWLLSVARAGKPNEVVGKKLTERDLQNLLKRSACPGDRRKAA